MISLRSGVKKDFPNVTNQVLPAAYFAKTYRLPSNEIRLGQTVLEHCRIVGQVARELIRRFSLSFLHPLFPDGSELVAASHDIGKISPTFQKTVTRNFPEKFSGYKGVNAALERNWGGHAGVSQLSLQAANVGAYIPEICGQHHGYNPQVDLYQATSELFGGENWQQERTNLIEKLQEDLQVDWPVIDTPEQARLVAGLTSVADWIGSGSVFDDPAGNWKSLIGYAVDHAGFVPPVFTAGLSFSEVFGADFSPYPVQEQFINQVDGPGIYVLEAPMGMGKTEAALYAAYALLCDHQATGIYFALPSQLTSNKIYQRFNSFLNKILADDCIHRQALLLHGKAWLRETEIGGEGAPGNSWFNSKKRGLLAPFGVGTLDQALMAAMHVKHGFVRAFGLAGKVVILDEVHTYDAYTGTIIDALVDLLQKFNCTVIILSATLNQDRRKELLGAELHETAFPLITAGRGKEKPVEQPVPITEDDAAVSIHLTGGGEGATEEAMKRAEQGQQVLWIENTVAEAQERYRMLAARSQGLGIACGLLHSRFTADDRQRIEERWINLFGKPGWPDRGGQGRLLVGTQVLEQSLDIDADFLVTRFCPTDMLLQRIGRVWRHQNTPRNPAARKEVWILAPPLADAVENPLQYFGATAWVYSPYVLCRSLEVWQDLRRLTVPADIRPLIEDTYASRQESGRMEQWHYELEHGNRSRKGRLALQQLAKITLARGGKTLPEAKAQTRYSEEESCEVLLLRSVTMQPEHNRTLLTLLNGEQVQLAWSRGKQTRKEWRQLSARLMSQMVPVRPRHAPGLLPMDTLKNKLKLHHCFYLGNPEREEAVLRLALVDEAGDLQGYQGAPLNENYILQYRNDLGYCVTKMGKD